LELAERGAEERLKVTTKQGDAFADRHPVHARAIARGDLIGVIRDSYAALRTA
jgi:hypothetical protein